MLRRLAGRVVAGLAVVARALAAVLDTWARNWDGAAPRAGGPPPDWVAKVRANAPWLLEPPEETPSFHDVPVPHAGPRHRGGGHQGASRARRQHPPHVDGASGRALGESSTAAAGARRAAWPATGESAGPRVRGAVADAVATAKRVAAVSRRAIEGAAQRREAPRTGAEQRPSARRGLSSTITVASAEAGAAPPRPTRTGGEGSLRRRGRVDVRRRERIDVRRRRTVSGFPSERDGIPHSAGSSVGDGGTVPVRETGHFSGVEPSRGPRGLEVARELPRPPAPAYGRADGADPSDLDPVAGWPELPVTREEGVAAVAGDDDAGAWPDLPPGLVDDEGPVEALRDRDHHASLDAELRSL